MKKLICFFLIAFQCSFAQQKENSQAIKALMASESQLEKQPDSAYFYANKAFKIAKQDGDKKLLLQANFAISKSLKNIGKVKPAVIFAQQGLSIAQQLNDDQGMLKGWILLGNCYASQQQFDKAKLIYTYGFKYFSKPKKLPELSAINNAFAELYLQMGNKKLAGQFYKDNIHNNSIPGNNIGAANAHNQHGSFLAATNDFKNAIPEYLEAIRLLKTDPNAPTEKIQGMALQLSDAYRKSGNIEKADEYLEISNGSAKKAISEPTKIAAKSPQKPVIKQKAPEPIIIDKKSIPEPTRKSEIYVLFLLIISIALTLFALYLLYRNKILREEKRSALAKMKSHLFANIAQELSLIDGDSEQLSVISAQLLELSNIENGQLKPDLKPGSLSDFIDNTIQPFVLQAAAKEVNFISNVEKTDDSQYFDKDIIAKIITTLMANAFATTLKNEHIYFSATIIKKRLQIRISNSGSTLKKEALEKLFDQFYEKNENDAGVGIGLALVKELVACYHGEIEPSIHENTLRFVISLPLKLG
ncbi:MAG TPA: ATP-binding protein [Flavobacterium sp.]|nr:ATP-binding protein [Flavobacterium sp.]